MKASTPSGAAARIRSTRPSPCATGTTPCARSHSWLAADAIPTTVAPVRRASCTVSTPTPPAAAETTTVSPGWGSTARTAAQAVAPTTCSAPACSHASSAASGRSARPARPRTRPGSRARRSIRTPRRRPRRSRRPAPSALTVPARSLPCPDGNVEGHRSRVAALPDVGLTGVDPRRRHLDQHLVGPGLRLRHLGDAQDVDPTEFVVLAQLACPAQPAGRVAICPLGPRPVGNVPVPPRTVQRRATTAATPCTDATSWTCPPTSRWTARRRRPPAAPRPDRWSSSASCPPSASPAACACG